MIQESYPNPKTKICKRILLITLSNQKYLFTPPEVQAILVRNFGPLDHRRSFRPYITIIFIEVKHKSLFLNIVQKLIIQRYNSTDKPLQSFPQRARFVSMIGLTIRTLVIPSLE